MLEWMLTVLTVVAVTVLTRFLSFVLFPLPERTPAFVRYLGRVLPAAVFGFLVVYCLRGDSALHAVATVRFQWLIVLVIE